jgi:hypothetical protein
VRACDGKYTDGPSGSNVVTIENSAPKLPTIAVDPAKPASKDNLICGIERAATDLGGDTLRYEFDCERDGALWTAKTSTTDHTGDTIDSSDTSGGQNHLDLLQYQKGLLLS